jgi:hypothetical protein
MENPNKATRGIKKFSLVLTDVLSFSWRFFLLPTYFFMESLRL